MLLYVNWLRVNCRCRKNSCHLEGWTAFATSIEATFFDSHHHFKREVRSAEPIPLKLGFYATPAASFHFELRQYAGGDGFHGNPKPELSAEASFQFQRGSGASFGLNP